MTRQNVHIAANNPPKRLDRCVILGELVLQLLYLFVLPKQHTAGLCVTSPEKM